MYNRYIPQPDGSYRRNSVPDVQQNNSRQQPREEPRRPEPAEPVCCPEPECREEPPCQKGQPCAHMRPPRQNRQTPPPPPRQNRQSQQQQPERKDFFGVGNFLRQLLPRDFDTEDLLIVLLLLLMSGDCAEDQNFALLTLALYLFM